MKLISRLLKKNTSPARIAGFIVSNFVGLAIIAGGVQFYMDARSLWQDDDSFIKTDYLVINKKVTASSLWSDEATGFSSGEISDIRRQPWVRDVGGFLSTDYRVMASVSQGGRGMSTLLFFESIPDEFVDVSESSWRFQEGDNIVPIIISKDYLTLYNFGFATSSGLPQITEDLMSGIPLSLTLTSEDGTRTLRMEGRVVGFSNRLNTILVPESFMKWSNARLGDGKETSLPSRLIIDVSSPGDVAIKDYMETHDLEIAGDKRASSAAYLLNVVVGIVVGIGSVITIMSLFILMLSISLLMEKNRDKLHSLLMLGYPLKEIGAPYVRIIVTSSLIAFMLSSGCVMIMRGCYAGALRGLGGDSSCWWVGIVIAGLLTAIVILLNIRVVRNKVREAF